MTRLAEKLEADSTGLLATIAQVAQTIGLPANEQSIINRLASGTRQSSNFGVTPVSDD